MTLTELRYIVMLARERHFGRAAEKCHISQPTLSVALKKVEQRYGIDVYKRQVFLESSMELERILRSQGFGSRPECRALIRSGQVSMDGTLCGCLLYTS